MTYPDYLLPKHYYRIINFDAVNVELRYLVRHTETKDITDKSGTLKSDLVSTDERYNHLRDFSTNLLGTFQIADIKWKWNRNSSCLELWQEGTDAIKPTIDDAEEDSQRGVFYLSIAKCHGVQFKTESEEEGENEVTSKVLHTPIKANFWHCSIRWFCGNQDSTEWNKGRLRRMKSTIRSFIVENAEINEPMYQAIDPQGYN
jgi:hypothetical protein